MRFAVLSLSARRCPVEEDDDTSRSRQPVPVLARPVDPLQRRLKGIANIPRVLGWLAPPSRPDIGTVPRRRSY